MVGWIAHLALHAWDTASRQAIAAPAAAGKRDPPNAPRVARRAHAPTFTRIRNQKVVLAGVAIGARKAMGKNAAFEIAPKSSLDIARWRGAILSTTLAAGQIKPRRKMRLDDAIPQRLLGATPSIALAGA